MKNKLIELLNPILLKYRFDAFENSDKIADHLIADGATIQRWIPANEPPKEAGEYNVAIKGASVSTTLFYSVHNKAWYDDYFEQPYEVTHWMSLPEPPKEEA